jgi:DNA adenine methylase
MLKTKSLKPFLKWAGGKARISDKLSALYDPHRDRRLVEPFCGGLGVALSLMPDRALLIIRKM